MIVHAVFTGQASKARAEFNLLPLTWSCKLADTAQDWANQGKFQHRPDFEFGESIFVSSVANDSPAEGIRDWLLEKSFWNNSD
ncbi:MAG: CAP domain-containing protein, partial [Chloroflexota bacterium]